MTTAVRLCVSCLLLSTSLIGGAHLDPEDSSKLPAWSSPADDERARCVDITASLSSCRRLGYRQMRLPSLLNDTVNATAASWAVSLIDQCGEDGLVLLCSLLAPVCIDRPIWPCSSLCRNVTGACRDVAALVDCEALPSDDQLCIGPRSSNSTGRKVSHSTKYLLDARRQRK